LSSDIRHGRHCVFAIERPDIEKRYWKNVLWSPSYFAASCGGAPLGIIQQYVEQQKTPL
jgi:putative transposase